jgi:hypothetical protein
MSGEKAFDELEEARREALVERSTPNELAGALLIGLLAHLEAQLEGVAAAKIIFGSRAVAMQTHRSLKEIIAKDSFGYGKLEAVSGHLLALANMPESPETIAWKW